MRGPETHGDRAPTRRRGRLDAAGRHGGGRRESRTRSRRDTRGRSLFREFRERGILVRSDRRRTVAEEAPEAYKDVQSVIDVVATAGIGRPVARLLPLGVVRG